MLDEDEEYEEYAAVPSLSCALSNLSPPHPPRLNAEKKLMLVMCAVDSYDIPQNREEALRASLIEDRLLGDGSSSGRPQRTVLSEAVSVCMWDTLTVVTLM